MTALGPVDTVGPYSIASTSFRMGYAHTQVVTSGCSRSQLSLLGVRFVSLAWPGWYAVQAAELDVMDSVWWMPGGRQNHDPRHDV